MREVIDINFLNFNLSKEKSHDILIFYYKLINWGIQNKVNANKISNEEMKLKSLHDNNSYYSLKKSLKAKIKRIWWYNLFLWYDTKKYLE